MTPALAVISLGAFVLLGLSGLIPSIAFAGRGWRLLFGWLAWPCAILLGATGVLMLRKRERALRALPWARALGVELALAACAALIATAFDPGSIGAQAPASGGAGGLAGWALATSTDALLGTTAAILIWLGIGALGIAAAFDVRRRFLADRPARVAETPHGGNALEASPVEVQGGPSALGASP